VGALRRVLVGLFRRIIGIYFREIEVTGNLPGADVGGRIFVSNHVNAIVDPILVLTTAPCPISPVAKSTLWKIPGLRALLTSVDAVPIVRRKDDPTKEAASNDAVFDRVAAWLEGGGNILIFPEGVSHSEPRLVEVKTGAARMLARAREKGARGLTFQAVALEFDARDIFRSRALLLYGPVRQVDDFGLEGHELVTRMTAELRQDLSDLLVEGATWPDRLLIARVAEMLAHEGGDRSLSGWSSIGRQVKAARKALATLDEATVQRIAAAVDRYYARLGEEGLTDANVAIGGITAELRSPGKPPEEGSAGPSAIGTALRAAGLIALVPLALVGAVLYRIPYQVPRIAARLVDEADEVSTYKLGAGLVVFPLWAAGLITAAFLVLPLPLAILGAAIAVTSPFAALYWLDVGPGIRRSLRLAARATRIDALKKERAEVLALVQRERERLGM
jgi:1-acyl-sn-glycerol-3-phosphate acyltransferase